LIPRKFQYTKAQSISETLTFLQSHPEAKVLAGGMSLIPIMKLRLASPSHLVDISGLRDLSYIKKDRDAILIGALTRHNEIRDSELIRAQLPILSDATDVIGDEQVRNMGTIGGSLAHADPAADYGGVVLAMNATIKVVGINSRTTIAAKDFFVDTFVPALNRGELITEIEFPILPNSSGAYLKLERREGDFAIVGVGAFIQVEGETRCKNAGIGLVSVGDTPIKAYNAENALIGQDLSDKIIEDASDSAAQRDAKPSADLKGSQKYKREMVRVFTERAIRAALSRIRKQ
jgi:carbon-monoxide dehydrogenase medium subunit